ncbi:hypothetical protein [Acidocella sp.]|uniref:hypothetical protein n=1 Tax=Acidocella sp. TaxID=50710 RepID=UPI003D034458
MNEFLECVDLMKKHMRIERASLLFSEKEYFWWTGRGESALSDEQQSTIDDLLETASGVRFDHMSTATKQIVWKGVRFYYGLSETDLPYPAFLDTKSRASKLPFANPLDKENPKPTWSIPGAAIIAFIACAFAAGMLAGNVLLPPASQNPSPVAAALYNRSTPNVPEFGRHEQQSDAVQMRSSTVRAP